MGVPGPPLREAVSRLSGLDGSGDSDSRAGRSLIVLEGVLISARVVNVEANSIGILVTELERLSIEEVILFSPVVGMHKSRFSLHLDGLGGCDKASNSEFHYLTILL